MEKTAEVVIIGGGAVGLSTAYHLAKRGLNGVVLLEKDFLGEGSTGRCTGGVRLDFSTEVNVRFSLEAFAVIDRFKEEFGVDPEFRRVGYLMLASTEPQLEQFKANQVLYARLGIRDVELLTPDEVQSRWPYVQTDDLLGATSCARDGFMGPAEVVEGYRRRARELGAKIYQQTRATGIEVSSGRVLSVRTEKGSISTRTVVNAGGPFAAEIGRMVGIDIRVEPIRRQIFVSGPIPAIEGVVPVIIDLQRGTAYRREGQGFLLYGPRDVEPSHNTVTDWEGMVWAVEQARQRIPAMARAEVVGEWAGTYEISPDNHAIMGPVPGVEGFLVANGFSGHGFMHSPVTGRLMAEFILDGEARTIDVSSLSIERFAAGETFEERLTTHSH
ncbi:MAG: NAD(P)/FAD-dependent oxidoreductase [Nitrospinota bacterium]